MLLDISSIMVSKSENPFIMNGEWTSLDHVLMPAMSLSRRSKNKTVIIRTAFFAGFTVFGI